MTLARRLAPKLLRPIPRSIARSRGVGGTGGGVTPPATGDMLIGMNVQGNSTGGGSMPFANMMWQALPWVRYSGAGSYTQNQGTLTASVGTDRFYAVISADGISMPSGTYTFLNPDGASGVKLGIGTSPGVADLVPISSATSATFPYTGDVGTGLFIHAEGSVTMASSAIGGGVGIIIPGHAASWAGGDYFNSAWVSFQQGLGTQYLRTMDMALTNINIDTNWADRTVANKLTFYGPGGPAVPWEILFAMANRLGRDPWICVPYRATTAYMASLGALAFSSLNVARNVYVEPGNELWNFSGAFSAGYYWTMFRTHTRRLCTVNAATGVLTFNAHGYTSGQVAHGWAARSSRTALVDDGDYYGESRGGERWIEVLTVNTFKLHANSGLTAPITSFPAGVTELVIINEAEAGKPAGNVDGNYGTFCTEAWSAFDTAFGGATRVKAVCGSQSSNSSRATTRLAVSGVSTRCNHLAIAPYWRGFIFHAVIDSTSGQFVPKVWANGTVASTIYVGFYTPGSTPTIAEVKAGTGTGYVASSLQTFTQTYAGLNTYTSGAAKAVSNGTTYKVYFVIVDRFGFTHVVSGNITASASGFSQAFVDTYGNQKVRDLLGIDSPVSDDNVAGVIAAHKAIAVAANPAITMIAYEGGSHWDEEMPTAMRTYMDAYVESTEYGDVLKQYLNTCADNDLKLFTYYQDCANSLSWTLCDSITDTSDARYVALASFSGAATKRTLLGLSGTVQGTNVLTDPLNFPTPTTVKTFSNAALTYAILAGDDEGNFTESANLTQMINDIGVNWAAITFKTLKMSASDGNRTDFFDLSFGLGPIWFASDANSAWRASDDTNTAAVNPTIGGVLTKTAGTDATIAADGWDLGGTAVYQSNNGMTSEAFYSQPFLAICVARKDDESLGGQVVLQFGSSDLILFEGIGGIRLDVRWYNGGRGINQSIQIAAPWAAGTMAVYWAYFDAVNLKFYAGHNQTDDSAGGFSYASQGSQRFDKAVQMGASNSVVKAWESITRSSMTYAQALAEVQAVQTALGL